VKRLCAPLIPFPLDANVKQKEIKIQVSMSRTRSVAGRPERMDLPHLLQLLRHDVRLGWSTKLSEWLYSVSSFHQTCVLTCRRSPRNVHRCGCFRTLQSSKGECRTRLSIVIYFRALDYERCAMVSPMNNRRDQDEKVSVSELHWRSRKVVQMTNHLSCWDVGRIAVHCPFELTSG
jgi:hypothetical protein